MLSGAVRASQKEYDQLETMESLHKPRACTPTVSHKDDRRCICSHDLTDKQLHVVQRSGGTVGQLKRTESMNIALRRDRAAVEMLFAP